MKLLGTVLAITAIPLLACGGDDGGGGRAITWRVPCATSGFWDAVPSDVSLTVFTYDARRHPTHRVTTLPDGSVTSTIDQVWDGDRLQSTDVDSDSRSYRVEITWAGDQITRVVRTDRRPASGNDTSYVATYHYDGDALVAYDLDWVEATRDDRHVTITGNRSTEEVDLDCSVQDPTQCDRSVWSQPDGDPENWTRGSIDFGNDGVFELQWDRELDGHGLELQSSETDIPSGNLLVYRYDFEREDDGTELGHTYALFAADGTVTDTYRETAQFTCGGARVAATGARGAAARLDAVEAARTELLGWRRDLSSIR